MNPGEVTAIIQPFIGQAGQGVPTQLNLGKTEARASKTCLLSARHNLGGNLLFLDGHVGWERYQDAITKQSKAGKGG